MTAKPYIILDRDGVINHDSDDYIKNANEWLPIEGSLEAIAELSQQGIQVFIATNQSGIGRNYYSVKELEEMHDKMRSLLGPLKGSIKDIFFCPHHPDDKCNCRKPATGLLDQLESKHKISVEGVPFIGDTQKDLDLAKAKNCLPILVRTGKGEKLYQSNQQQLESTLVFNTLLDATHYLMEHHYQP